MSRSLAKQRHEHTSPLVGRTAPAAKRPGRVGARTCVGCREEAGKADLIRVVRRADGGAAVDRTGRVAGRGAYVHDDPACVELARKRRSLDRALHATIQPELWSDLVRSVGLSHSPETAELGKVRPARGRPRGGEGMLP